MFKISFNKKKCITLEKKKCYKCTKDAIHWIQEEINLTYNVFVNEDIIRIFSVDYSVKHNVADQITLYFGQFLSCHTIYKVTMFKVLIKSFH